MLTEKEVMKITEKTRAHIALIEKFRTYAQMTDDPQIKNLLERQQQILMRHYQILVGLLENARVSPVTFNNQNRVTSYQNY